MKCPNCGAEVTGRFCSYCGSEMPKEQANTTYNGNVVINNYYGSNQPKDKNYTKEKEDTDNSIYEQDTNEENVDNGIERVEAQYKDTNSKMSILALIFSIIGATYFIGIILSIIDLAKKDGRKKTISKVALVIGCAWLFIGFMGNFSDNMVDDMSEDYIEETIINGENKVQNIDTLTDIEQEEIDNDLQETDDEFYPRETDEIIELTDYVSFWENYSNQDAKRWYKITGRIYSVNDNIIEIRDGLTDNFTAMLVCYFNDDVDLSNYREGDIITFVGFSGNKFWDSLMIEYCYIPDDVK